jgi:hypothetical protein
MVDQRYEEDINMLEARLSQELNFDRNNLELRPIADHYRLKSYKFIYSRIIEELGLRLPELLKVVDKSQHDIVYLVDSETDPELVKSLINNEFKIGLIFQPLHGEAETIDGATRILQNIRSCGYRPLIPNERPLLELLLRYHKVDFELRDMRHRSYSIDKDVLVKFSTHKKIHSNDDGGLQVKVMNEFLFKDVGLPTTANMNSYMKGFIGVSEVVQDLLNLAHRELKNGYRYTAHNLILICIEKVYMDNANTKLELDIQPELIELNPNCMALLLLLLSVKERIDTTKYLRVFPEFDQLIEGDIRPKVMKSAKSC